MIKGLIFDLDGTLIDSMGVWNQIDIDFLGKRGLSVPDDYLEKITPLGFYSAAQYTIERFGFQESPEEIEEEWLTMAEEAYGHSISMKKGAIDFLKWCKQKKYRMAVATSSLERLYEPCLKNHGLENMFEFVITTREAGADKKMPKIYEMASKRFGLTNQECMVFEDIYIGLETAKKAGFSTVAVQDKASASHREEIQKMADYYLTDFVNAEEKLSLFF